MSRDERGRDDGSIDHGHRATLEPGVPVALFPTRIVGGGVDTGLGRQYDMTRDGRFLINTVLDEAPAPITLLTNWNPEAKPSRRAVQVLVRRTVAMWAAMNLTSDVS